MTRILLVETASPKRIYHKAEQILRSGLYPDPEITILCHQDTRQFFRNLPGAKICSLEARRKCRFPAELRRIKFDIVFLFWTGEKRDRRLKIPASRLKTEKIFIDAGDGNEFRLTWKAVCRHALFRRRHPLPTDHYDFLMPQAISEKTDLVEPSRNQTRVLILQSAGADFVLKALNRLQAKPLFRDPCYTLFCRNRQEIADRLRDHPLVDKLLLHTESRDSGKHLRNLRSMKFDAIVLFFTGDPSYWKMKLFAFLLGVPVRQLLVFNEASDCFFLNWMQLRALAFQRIRERSHMRTGGKKAESVQIPTALIIKSLLLPFRFLWLLLIWILLRYGGMKMSRKDHDYSIPLPPPPGT
jgi:hypothetical protein